MAAKPRVTIVGPGNLGTALALSLRKAGYTIEEIVARNDAGSLARARKVAALLSGRRRGGPPVCSIRTAALKSELVWLCMPDREISAAAQSLASKANWRGKIALHCSGALSSLELAALKAKGAGVASVHPLMTFVRNVRPSLRGVPFALEGDRIAAAAARRIVRDLGGEAFSLSKQYKPAYHAWGGFTSPLLVALLVAGEQVAAQAGIGRALARRRMVKIVHQTIENYFARGPAGAFSGPIVRGDIATVQKHLKTLSQIPDARQVYLALARSALKYLPGKNKRELSRVLEG
ncbi:MAG TPA: Rossmann-like and DUF2520 domain-containing protein [Terriglobales bacterium]|nr:Rossmann-like and DUF2520 domain-containing protein [Terriglobales bacterium]